MYSLFQFVILLLLISDLVVLWSGRILMLIRLSALQGMGNTVMPMASGIAEFVMRTGGVLLLPMVMGEQGIFLAEGSAWMGADLILIPSYFITLKQITKKAGS